MITTALRNLASGVMLGLISTVLSLSFAALLFGSGGLPEFQSGISVLLVTAVVATLVFGLFSSGSGVAATVLPGTVAMTAALLAGQSVDQEHARFVMAGVALFSALFMLGLGQSGAGRVIRYLPLPVMAGLLAGIGWLFAYGGIKLAQPDLLSVAGVTSPTLWLVLAFAALLFLGQKKLGGSLVLPTGFLILVFFFNLLGAGMPEWSGNWLLEGNSHSFFAMTWLPEYATLSLDGLLSLPWMGMISLALVSVLLMLMQAVSLEQNQENGLDLNRELHLGSGANLVTGILGGGVASLSRNQTDLNHQLGGQGKAPAIIAAVILTLLCFSGGLLWQYLPIPAVAVVLVYQGMNFIDQWLVSARERFSSRDHQIIALLFAVTLLAGFLSAVFVGVVIALLMFIRQYRQASVIQLSTDSTQLHSRVERPLRHKKALEKYGDRVRIVRLKGDLSFGTAFSLLEELQSSLQPPTVFLILDFARVSGSDASTVNDLLRLHQTCLQRKVILLLTAVPIELKALLDTSGMAIEEDNEGGRKLTTKALMKVAGLFSDWDRCLEWCENELLSRLPTNESGEFTLESVLKERMDILPYEVVHLVRYFEPVKVKAGEHFIRQGKPANSMFVLTKGKAEIQLDLGDDRYQKLKTMMPGTIIGELGVYTGSDETISAVALEDTELMRLDASALKEMEAHNQLMAIRLHRFVVMLVAERLTESDKVLKKLF